MVTGNFSVSWDSFESNIRKGFNYLQQHQELVDLTLAADGHFVKVHKVIIALASPYLKELIASAPCQHPVIFLNNVPYNTFCSILEYIYMGSVAVPTNEMTSFITIAKALHIKGLENVDTKRTTKTFEDSDCEKSKIMKYDTEETQRTSEDAEDTPFAFVELNNSDAEDQSTKIINNKVPQKLKKKEPTLQFTVSNRGYPQVILNRYMYNLQSKQSSGTKRWLCLDSRNKKKQKCSASVITRGNRVIRRLNLHCHSFHDKKILVKTAKNEVFSTLEEFEEYKVKENNKEMEKEDQNIKADDKIIIQKIIRNNPSMFEDTDVNNT